MFNHEIVWSSWFLQFHHVHSMLNLLSTKRNIKKNLFLWKDTESRVVTASSVSLVQSSFLLVIWQGCGSVEPTLLGHVANGSETRAASTHKRVHWDFFLSSIAAQNFVRCWTSLCRAHWKSYKGPLGGLSSLHYILHASLLFRHSWNSVPSLNCRLSLASGVIRFFELHL